MKLWGRAALVLAAALGAGACVFLAVLLALRGLAQASSLAGVLALPVGIVAAAAAVLAVLPHGPKSADDALDGIAEDLAKTLDTQWADEAGLRGFGGPHSLRVSWQGTTDYFESWEFLERTARDGFSGDGPQDSSKWAASPVELAGSDDAAGGICAALDKVPTGRLVTLGEPGAGKSILMIRLARALLARRHDGCPVPVIVSLASWNPEEDNLSDWLLNRLSIDYPNLRQPFGRAKHKTTRGDALLKSGKIMLILDGLDEISEEFRGTAIHHINETLGESQKLILACRKEEYEKATRPQSGAHVSLLGAAGIILQALDPQEVAAYLRRGAQSSTAAASWDPVVAVLGTDNVLGRTLTTPLTVTLAHAVYNPEPLTQSDSVRVPADLLAEQRFPTEESIKEHLFAAFIEAAYHPRARSGRTRPPQADRARRWLTFLARNPGLAWWELPAATPIPVMEIAVGAVCGIAAGIAAISGRHAGVGIGLGLGVGIMIGLAAGIPFRSVPLPQGADRAANAEDPTPARGVAGGLVGGITGGLAAGFAGVAGFGYAASAVSGIPVALGVGLATGACTTFYGGIVGGLLGGFAAGALEGVGTGQTAGIVNGLGVGLVAMLIIRLVGRDTPAARRKWESRFGVPGGLAVGAATGIIAGFKEGPAVGMLLGASLGLVSAWPIGLRGIKTARAEIPPAPHRSLARDARAFWTTALAAGLAAGAFGFWGDGLASVIEEKAKLTFSAMISGGLAIGIASGLIVGLVFGVYHSAAPGFLITRIWLSMHGELPWRLMDFLNDAHKVRRVLRQNGARYEFTHVELQRYLVQATESESSGKEPPRLNFGAYREIFSIWRVHAAGRHVVRILKHADFVASNVPGVPRLVYLADSKVTGMFAFGPPSGLPSIPPCCPTPTPAISGQH